MNQVAEDNTINGRPQTQASAPTPVHAEGEQAPSAEANQPFVPEKKKASGRDNWRAILAGIGIVAVILVAALTHSSGTKPRTSAPNTNPATKEAQPSGSPYGSTIPVNDIGNNSDKPADGSKIGPGAIASTAKPRPATTTATNLSEVPAFGNADNWQPPAFHDGAPAAANDNQEQKNDHDALDKPSLVFVRNTTATARPEDGQATLSDLEPSLGLPAGTRLRAHLESAVSTAVQTPVIAAIEYNYEREGEILVPAGAKAIGHLESADRSGYVGIRFDKLLMPNGASLNIQGAATDLQLRPVRGKVQGKNTGKNVLVRSLAGVGEAMATLVGQGGLNQPLNEADLLRGRVVSNIGQASDQEVARLAITERVIVSVPASTEIYVILEKETKEPPITATSRPAAPNATAAEQLRQLLQLQRELNQTTASGSTNQ